MYGVKEIEYSDWTNYIKEFEHTNLLQYGPYGAAKEQTSYWKSVRFMVTDGNEIVALAQFLAITLPLFGGIARMNRGPLLSKEIQKDDRESVSCKLIAALVEESQKRHWWVVQIAPDLPDTDASVKALKYIGLKKLDITPYASGLISLYSDEEEMLMSLKGKWRNCLRKGFRSGVKVTQANGNSSEMNILINRYRQLQQDKGFLGIKESLINALAEQKDESWEFKLFFANQDEHIDIENSVGVLVCIRHGDTATYFIGSTNDKGRNLHANYVLLWEAILYAKHSGCKWFDIGGLDSTTPKGIAHFKQGLNSELYNLVGEWRGFFPPWKSNKFKY